MNTETDDEGFVDWLNGFLSRQWESIVTALGVSCAVNVWGDTYLFVAACGFVAGVCQPAVRHKINQMLEHRKPTDKAD